VPSRHTQFSVAFTTNIAESNFRYTQVSKPRLLKSGKKVGGISFARGALAHLLRNRFYIGEVTFKGEVLPGEQPAIVDRKLFDAVQARLNEQLNSHKVSRSKSEALLAGRIFDDRGNRMTPSHARKNGTKYRYYISSVLVQGQGEQAGTVNRIPAADVEARIIKAVRSHIGEDTDLDDRKLINERVIRIEVQAHKLVVELARTRAAGSRKGTRRDVIEIPWSKPPSKQRREILIPQSQTSENIRPIRSENRATLVTAIARGRRWLDELIANPATNPDGIAKREGCTARQINMMISLAFLAPDLVKAAIEGKLPHGMGVRRLRDMPPEWSRQRQTLGL
jgi:site-specific DNA recombinase